MDALWNAVQSGFILIAGLAVRFAIALALFAVLLAILVPIVYASEGVRRLVMRAAGFEPVAGLNWRRHTYYTPAHAWLRRRAGLLRVGLDDLAGRILRRVDSLLLPAEGTSLKAGDALLTITSGRRGIVIPAPIDGIVARVNRGLADDPDKVVRDPYRRGWLVEMRPATDRYAELPRDSKARYWFESEAVRLSIAVEHAAGMAAADGGEPTVPPHLLVSDEQFSALARDFLDARLMRAADVA